MNQKSHKENPQGTQLQETVSKKLSVNNKHKDLLFTEIFNTEEALLSLYNAVNNSNYTDPEKLQVHKLGNFLFLGMYNDISFCINCSLNLYEHQSSINMNMPLRNLLYVADIIKTYIKERDLDIHGSKLIKLPNPKFVVFYNGEEYLPEKSELSLKDAFEYDEGDYPLDLKVTVYNINYGYNKAMMSRCRLLEEYAIFIAAVRAYMKEFTDRKYAVRKAAEECIAKGILKDILLRGGIIEMIDLYYEEQLHRRSEAAYNQEIGEQRGKIDFILDFLADKGIVPTKLKEHIQEQTDANLLRLWHKEAAFCSSINDFCEAIGFKG